MPGMNGTGPEGKGAGTGRRLGKCKESEKTEDRGKLGRGLGKRLRVVGGQGMGRRTRSGNQ
jgi:hypothetical protein